MAQRNLVMALSLVSALALPASTALAAGHGHGYGRGGHKPFCGVATRHESEGKNRRQLEGTVVSLSSTPAVSGTTFVLQPQGNHGMTVTVGITSGTVITADQGVTTTTLAPGEQVHVAARAGAACTVTATRVQIQGFAKGERHHDADDKKGGKGDKGKGVRHETRQLEGTVVSLSSTPAVSGTTFVLQPQGNHGMTVTVGITSGTVITADQGVTTTTLAPGEQVHVAAQPDAAGLLQATRVTIQQATTESHGKGHDADHKKKR